MLDQEHGSEPAKSPVRLTQRELEVLELASFGLTNMQIAGRINVSVHAVKFHLSSIFGKLGVSNRTEAAVQHLRSNQGESTSS